MPEAVIQLLQAHPWVIWVYMAALVIAAALRVTWDVTEERPRIIRFILAIADVLQLNLSGPAKLVSNQIKGKTPQ